ncbi:hypothetical protein [Solitalea lacus]|uniref:hypothetical protein n=1 Tax=Solitalea lacus TaxID=2911172 RepID=UPI001EDB8056|nr:hypothetical protein [Solitalea lacus]UKJ08452.1 hypothetical protein L2B55_04610 [Solitalea lacus]
MTHQDIRSYFEAEKSATLLILFIGGLAIAIAVVFFFFKSKPYFGAAFPLLIVGIVEVVVGYTVYSRADKQISDVIYSYDMNPDYLKDIELPRIEKVITNFKKNIYVELAMLVLSSILIYFNYNKHNVWLGVGGGLLLQILILIVFDQIAERRAQVYQDKLSEFVKK